MPRTEAPARPPIDPEELAAFIDGRLEGDRRRLMIERLADDEDAYELYDEVIRVREELAEDEGDASAKPPLPAAPAPTPAEPEKSTRPERTAPVVRLPSPAERRYRWLGPGLAAAASLVLAALVGWLLFVPRGPVADSSDLLARYDPASLPSAAGVMLDRLGPTLRGADPLTPEERAAFFQLGVRAFDLALAAETGDAESTERWLREIIDLLGKADVTGLVYQGVYKDVGDTLAAGTSPAELRRAIAAAEADLEEDLDLPDAPYFAFGRWIEALRVAAATGDRTFLASRAARRPLDRFLDLGPSPTVEQHLTAAAAQLERGAAADLAAIETAMREIIRECARGAPCFGAQESS